MGIIVAIYRTHPVGGIFHVHVELVSSQTLLGGRGSSNCKRVLGCARNLDPHQEERTKRKVFHVVVCLVD